jgi:hypothetical protein
MDEMQLMMEGLRRLDEEKKEEPRMTPLFGKDRRRRSDTDPWLPLFSQSAAVGIPGASPLP